MTRRQEDLRSGAREACLRNGTGMECLSLFKCRHMGETLSVDAPMPHDERLHLPDAPDFVLTVNRDLLNDRMVGH